MSHVSRRSFISTSSVALVAGSALLSAQDAPVLTPAPLPSFPTQEPDLVREMVGASHNNFARVKVLVERQPTLAKAAWDWGFGDWEDCLGASSHVGNREIAHYLLDHGARPTIFSAAMLGQLDVVKAFVTMAPGIERTKGPHGITLLAHAANGGSPAAIVLEYLKTLEGANAAYPNLPAADDQIAALTGTYVYGPSADERFEVGVTKTRQLTIKRSGRTERNLFHQGSLEFFPAGADRVRIAFASSNGTWTLTVHDPDLVVTAKKVPTFGS
jgi:hypothetical protein